MYINSNFSDYYDFCTKYGQDSKIVYNRKTSKVPVNDKTTRILGCVPLDSNNPAQFLKLCANAVELLNPVKVYSKNTGWSLSYPISFYCIGASPYFLIHETHTAVTFAEAWEYKNERHQQRNGYFCNRTNALGKNFEALCKQEKLISLHTHLGVPVFGLDYLDSINPQSWTLNPCLKDIKFPVDPVVVYTAIFNSLQASEPQTLEVQNKYKVLAHGMDNASFKREAGGPTRKRKKIKLGMI